MSRPYYLLLVTLSLVVVAFCATAEDDLATELLYEMVAENTAPSGGGDLRPIVARIEARLREAGFGDDDIDIVYSGETLPNLVVRYRAPTPEKNPLLMMAHLDVVEALPSDWTVPPFSITKADGYYYGRGTVDNKGGAAILIANLIRMKRERFEPNRDLIVMLTADEETTGAGATLLANDYRELIDAEFALNTDGGMVVETDGVARAFLVQTSEKVYVTYRLEATDPGGHSSIPRGDSAISRLARTLVALQDLRFDIEFNDTTFMFFERSLPTLENDEAELIESLLAGARGEDISQRLNQYPYFNAILRTTCVATLISGGHAVNALPQQASADVNCRILPHSSEAEVRQILERLAAPNDVSLSLIFADRPSTPSPLTPEVIESITGVSQEFWPGIPIVPQMSTGGTDAVYVRNVGIPVYAVSGITKDPDDIRAHGQDERIGIVAFERALAYWYRLVTKMSSTVSD